MTERPDSRGAAARGKFPIGKTATRGPLLTIVIPACNEVDNLSPLHTRLSEALGSMTISWEIIFVDDGSTDGTWNAIVALREHDDRVKGVRLSRNFGHQYALVAGLEHASGRAVVSMDADLQHPPEVVPRLLEEWGKGSKIVSTIRQAPRRSNLFRRLSSRVFYRLFSLLSGVPLENGMADFRLLDRQVVEDILQFKEEGLFLRGIVEWVGYPSARVVFQSEDRLTGVTKYTLRRMLKFAWRGISSFSLVPLRAGIVVGLAASGIAFAGVAYAIYGKLVSGSAISGWASTVAIVSFLFGVLFFYLGLLGEYVGRVVVEVRQRPRFLVSERLGVDPSPGAGAMAAGGDPIDGDR